MQKHIKNYTARFPSHSGYYSCEVCSQSTQDFHHIKRRSEFGKKTKEEQDKILNIIALCRECHEKAHANILTKEFLTEIHLNNL